MTFFVLSFSCLTMAKETKFIGKVPGEYHSKDKNKFYLSIITINDDVITSLDEINPEQIKDFNDAIQVQVNGNFAAIYPGLIDLHNHPKQNLLPLWDHARGQFGNRHEWRAWPVYSHSLGGNMNPWSGNGTVEVCAAFRWSELQATVLGTTLMQGPRFCTNNFSISHVEAGDGFYNEKTNAAGEFIAKELNVQAPTDLFQPEDMTYIYKVIKPLKTGNKSFHDALELSLTATCPKAIEEIKNLSEIENTSSKLEYEDRLATYNNAPNFNKFHSLVIAKAKLNVPYLFTKAAINYLADVKNLVEKCAESRGTDFDLYFTEYHASIVNKILLLKNPNNSGLLAHLSEGRRNDPYNKVEFEIAKTLDLVVPGMNFVHAVGLNKNDLRYLKKNNVGIIWSPFSNLLLYGETMLVKEALELGINIALGSDWTPTGSKSVLEEVKIAKRFAVKNKINNVLTDEILFKMMTENPAKMIGKFEVNKNDGRHGVGSIKPDAMASFIAVEIKNENPYSNIIEATENEVSLVISNGKVLYGNIELLNKLSVPTSQQDWVPVQYDLDETLIGTNDKYENISEYFNKPEIKKLKPLQFNIFNNPKAFVFNSTEDNEEILAFTKATSLEMGRPSDIQKVLHVLLTTQSSNYHNEKEEYAIEVLPPIVSLADKKYKERFDNFIKLNGSQDEIEQNYVYRLEWRREMQDERNRYNENNPHLPARVSVPYRLAKTYGLEYDIELGIVGY